MFNFRTDFRFRPVPRPLVLTQGPMAMRFGLDEALAMGDMVLNHVARPAIGGVSPHTGLLSVQQLGQHLIVMHIRRRGRHRMDQHGPTVYPEMGRHAERLLVPLLRLMPLGIPFLLAILRRTGGTDDGRIHDSPSAHL